jgi:hypothetical protein
MPLQCAPAAAGATTCVGTVELAFDRLLLPVSVTRQSIFLSDTRTPPNFFTPTIAYDPVARVVSITPTQDAPFTVGLTYRVQIASPSAPTDPNGLRAIDGAPLDPAKRSQAIEFMVTAAATAPPAPPVIDFCAQVITILQGSCGSLGTCHGYSPIPLAAEGLILSKLAIPKFKATAIGRVAQESNSGAFSHGQPVSRIFGQDMPIIDPGDPGNSWLLYKTLMAAGPGTQLMTTASAHSVPWMPLSDSERTTLSSLIPGREMPLPTSDPKMHGTSLPLDTLEAISLWIAQGASAPDMCQ